MHPQTLHFGEQRSNSHVSLVVFGHSHTGKGVFAAGHATIIAVSPHKRGIFTAAEFTHALGKHGVDQITNKLQTHVSQIFSIIRNSIMLETDPDIGIRGLFIFCHANQRFRIIRKWIYYFRCGILDCRDGTKNLPDLFFHGIDIKITNNNNSLQIRAIPFMVEVSDGFVFKIIDHGSIPDHIPFGIFTAFVDHGSQCIAHAFVGRSVHAPLFADYTPFQIDFGIFKSNIIRPVVQDKQGGVDNPLPQQRNIGEIVNCLFDTGPGIHILSELNADSSQIIEHGFLRIVCCPVKRHMFGKVGQTILIIFLLNSPNTVCNVKFSPFFRQSVIANIVTHAVFQHSGPDVGIEGRH